MLSCCVEGCRNYTCLSGTVDPSIFFYLFPKHKELKKKWLKAIRCEESDLPDSAHICSAHFSSQQMVQVSTNVWTLKKFAYPDIVSPLKVNNETSDIKVCRMCLASDCKMFSLFENDVLKTCIETIAGLHQNHDVGVLPQFVCYLCARYLMKTNNFIEKSMIAQATLLEIHAENLKITEPLVKEQNRHTLNLVHGLQRFNSTPTKVFEFVYDDKRKVSVLTNSESDIHCSKQVSRNKRSAEDLSSETNLKDKNLNKKERKCKKLKKNVYKDEDIYQDTNDETVIGKGIVGKKSKTVVESKIGCNKNANKVIIKLEVPKVHPRKASEKSDSDHMMLGSGSCDNVDGMITEEENSLSADEHKTSLDGNIEKRLRENDKEPPYESLYKCGACEKKFKHCTTLEQHYQYVHLSLSEQRNLAKTVCQKDIKVEIEHAVTEEGLDLEGSINESKFKLSKINHVALNEPIDKRKSKNKNEDRTFKVLGKSIKKEYLELKCEVDNDEESLDNKELGSEDETAHKELRKEFRGDDDKNLSENKDYVREIKAECLDIDDVYED